jgi:protein-S-isoprenylcysteine O-methyltransferase Ste14
MLAMTVLGWLAAVVLFLQLPIPLYWFVVHPQVNFWRRHQNASYVTGLLLSWPPVTAALIYFRASLFRKDWPPSWSVALGLALIVFEGWIFWRVHRDLGLERLVGKTELSGQGEIVQHGIYARIRHPRYAGSFLAIVGACLLAATPTMWIVASGWTVLTLTAIALEERELSTRFGPAYVAYCREVPRFIPTARPHY